MFLWVTENKHSIECSYNDHDARKDPRESLGQQGQTSQS